MLYYVKETRTDFVQRPVAVKFENVFETSEEGKNAYKAMVPPQRKFRNNGLNGNNEGHDET